MSPYKHFSPAQHGKRNELYQTLQYLFLLPQIKRQKALIHNPQNQKNKKFKLNVLTSKTRQSFLKGLTRK